MTRIIGRFNVVLLAWEYGFYEGTRFRILEMNYV
jgi:hypothetical protein